MKHAIRLISVLMWKNNFKITSGFFDLVLLVMNIYKNKGNVMETFFDELLNIIKNNYILAIALIVGFVLGQINNITSFINNIIKIWRLKNKLLNKNTPYVNFNEENFEKETNIRYGFSFLYPKTWDRTDPPTNSDGNTYVHPKNQDIKMLAWGNYDIEESLDEKIEEDDIPVSFFAKLFKRKKNRILLYVESGKNFAKWSKKNSALSMHREQLMGRRLVYQFKRDKKKITAMHCSTSFDDTVYNVLCEAPSNIFSEYEDLFIFLYANLKILGTTYGNG